MALDVAQPPPLQPLAKATAGLSFRMTLRPLRLHGANHGSNRAAPSRPSLSLLLAIRVPWLPADDILPREVLLLPLLGLRALLLSLPFAGGRGWF